MKSRKKFGWESVELIAVLLIAVIATAYVVPNAYTAPAPKGGGSALSPETWTAPVPPSGSGEKISYLTSCGVISEPSNGD